MSYDAIKTGLVDRLEVYFLKESKEAFNFESTGESKYSQTFTINPIEGETNDEFSTLLGKVHDIQTWQIQIAFSRSAKKERFERDEMQRVRENLVKDLDNPTNWQTFASELRYESWSIEEIPSYFVLTINIKIIDRLSY